VEGNYPGGGNVLVRNMSEVEMSYTRLVTSYCNCTWNGKYTTRHCLVR